jgi:hypothetical protein
MAGIAYSYIVDYDPDINRALQTLREREFLAGRYYPAVLNLWLRKERDLPSPGPQHGSIEEAREAAMEEGTQSILDLDHVSTTPETCAISPLKHEELIELYGTTKPTRDMVEFDYGWYDYADRGRGIYVIIYEDEEPVSLFIGGYSFD